MIIIERKKRLVRNLFRLLMIPAVAGLSVFIDEMVQGSGEWGYWPGMTVIFVLVICLLCFIVWNGMIARDILRFRHDRRFVARSLLLWCAPYVFFAGCYFCIIR